MHVALCREKRPPKRTPSVVSWRRAGGLAHCRQRHPRRSDWLLRRCKPIEPLGVGRTPCNERDAEFSDTRTTRLFGTPHEPRYPPRSRTKTHRSTAHNSQKPFIYICTDGGGGRFRKSPATHSQPTSAPYAVQSPADTLSAKGATPTPRAGSADGGAHIK